MLKGKVTFKESGYYAGEKSFEVGIPEQLFQEGTHIDYGNEFAALVNNWNPDAEAKFSFEYPGVDGIQILSIHIYENGDFAGDVYTAKFGQPEMRRRITTGDSLFLHSQECKLEPSLPLYEELYGIPEVMVPLWCGEFFVDYVDESNGKMVLSPKLISQPRPTFELPYVFCSDKLEKRER